MSQHFFMRYPIRNEYVYYLPQIQILNSHNIGGMGLKDIHIYTEPDLISDGYSEDHRFNTFHCNNITDSNYAWIIGLELTSLLRGLITIFYDENYQKQIFIEKMIKNDDPSVNYPKYSFGYDISISPDLYQSLGSNLLQNLNFTERKEYKENAKTNVFNSSLYLAQNNVGLYLILKYFSEPLTWVSLYKIMETLETIEKYHDKSWRKNYTNQDKAKFTNPANNFAVIGIDSRHGFKQDSLKQNNGPKMSLNEAKSMFIKCAQSYLNFKFNELISLG
ncbi:hypothetical protein ACX1N5_15650 [Acinetobacter sp. ANC 4636]